MRGIIVLVWASTLAVACLPSGHNLAADTQPGSSSQNSDGNDSGAASEGSASVTSGSVGISAESGSAVTTAAGASSSAPTSMASASTAPDYDAGTVNLCDGCKIGSTCVARGESNPKNPCEVCAPKTNNADWTPDDGQRCDDELFCTEDDRCRAGVCSGSPRECDDQVTCNGVSRCDEEQQKCVAGQNTCGADTVCDVETNKCVSTCNGCVIAAQCIPTGGRDPNNSCLTCQPSTSSSTYSAAVGAACGSTASECSAQDTCDAQGVCKPNHSPSGASCGDSSVSTCNAADTCNGNGQCQSGIAPVSTACSGGHCQAGLCKPDPFDCVLPSPPVVTFPPDPLGYNGLPPVARGGTITDGRYEAIQVAYYNGDPTIELFSFEFRDGFFAQVGATPYSSTGIGFIPEVQFVGSFKTSGTTLTFTLEPCDPGNGTRVPPLQYTATINGFVTIYDVGDGSTQVVTYARR